MPRKKKQDVWKHFITINKSAKCKHCDKLYKIANVNKMERHLLVCFNKGCPTKIKGSPIIKKQINIPAATRVAVTNQTRLNIQPPESIELQDEEASSLPSTSKSNVFTEERKQYLDQLISQAIFVAGAPISMVEHPLWVRVFQELQPLYKPPSREAIATTHLDYIYNQIEKEVSEDLESAKNVHLQCDGWSNQRVEGMITCIIAKPEPILVKSLNTPSNCPTREYLSQEILKIINVYGAHKFATLIGDNSNVIQKAFDLVQEKHPHIIPLRCVAHTLNLLCEDCLKPESIQCFVKNFIDIIKTIKRSQLLSSLLAEIVKEKGCGEALILPVKTRWGTYYAALKSVQKTKVALQTLAIHKVTVMANEHKAHLLDESFWIMIDDCIKLLQPINDKIVQLEGNDLNIHNVYLAFKDIESGFRFILPDINIINENNKNQILNALKARMNICIKPIHLATYMLDPKYQGADLGETQEVETLQFLYDVGEQMGLDIMDDLANYRAKEGFWGNSIVWKNVQNINPVVWWKGICGTKLLSEVAVQLLTTPCTSAPTEQPSSVLENIRSAKRNRLDAERAAKIGFISYNWNILHKNTIVTEDLEDKNVTASLSSPIPMSNINEPSTSQGVPHPIEFLEISSSATEDWDSD